MQESSSDKFASANMRLSVWQVHALELQKHRSKKNTISNDGVEKWKGLKQVIN